MITGVMEFGFFVTLTELYVDGLVHVKNMGDDFFEFDAASQTLNGKRHGQKFALGDKVRVKVAGVSLEDRKIDFEMMRQLSSAGRAVRSRAPRTQAAQGGTGPAAKASDTASKPKARRKPASKKPKAGKPSSTPKKKKAT